MKRLFRVVSVLLLLCAAGPAWAGPAAGGGLKIALLPILDALPFYVAEAEGFFDELAIRVDGLRVTSAVERDQLMQAGEIDAMLNEMMTTANFNRESTQVMVLCAARTAYPGSPLFRLLAAPGMEIHRVADLKGVDVGISKNTIIEYVTDRLLAAGGLPADAVNKRSVPVIPERYHLLMQGKIAAAVLPDPMAESAMAAGAHLIVDDSSLPQYSMSVLSFSRSAVTGKPETVRRFLAAWDRAAARLNADAESYRGLMLEKIRVPKNVQETFSIPTYPRRRVPTPEQWRDVMEWMVEKGLLQDPLPYQGSVTDRFLK